MNSTRPQKACNTKRGWVRTSFTSLMFERGRGWSGLLVEPHPLIFAKVTTQAASRKKLVVDFLTLVFLQKKKVVRNSAGASSSKESLERGNMPGPWHKVYFHQDQTTILLIQKKFQASSGKICFWGFTRCHGRPRSTRFSGQWNHRGEIFWGIWWRVKLNLILFILLPVAMSSNGLPTLGNGQPYSQLSQSWLGGCWTRGAMTLPLLLLCLESTTA